MSICTLIWLIEKEEIYESLRWDVFGFCITWKKSRVMIYGEKQNPFDKTKFNPWKKKYRRKLEKEQKKIQAEGNKTNNHKGREKKI